MVTLYNANNLKGERGPNLSSWWSSHAKTAETVLTCKSRSTISY